MYKTATQTLQVTMFIHAAVLICTYNDHNMGRAETIWNPLSKLRPQRYHNLKAQENQGCKKNSGNNVLLQ